MFSDTNPETVVPVGPSRVAPRIKVLIVAKLLVGGGAERVITTLARHLDRRVFEPHLATFGVGAYESDLPPDLTIHRLQGTKMKWAVPTMISLIRKIKPEIVFSTLIEMNVAVLLTRLLFPSGTKVIVRESINPSPLLKHMLPAPFAWKLAYRYVFPFADSIVCQSQSMEDDVLEHVPISRSRIAQIYNGVDVELVETRSKGSNPYVAHGPNLLAVGRLSAEKNFSMLLDAFTVIRTSLSSARLTILGSGPQEAFLKNKAKQLKIEDSVDFPGFMENPFPYYRHADLYLQTSTFEGLPNVLLEVLSLGTPSVATVAGGATEEIAQVVGSVRLVKEEGAQAFADAVLDTLRSPRSVLNREALIQHFGVNRMVTQYESLFSNIAVRP